MATDALTPGTVLRHELHSVRKHWWCFLVLGIALVIIGTFCIGAPLIASLASIVTLGFFMLAGGISQIVGAFWSGKWSGMLFHLLIGILYSIVGYMIIDNPGKGLEVATRLIAIFLIVSGTLRIVASLVERFHDWGWVLVNGAITLFLGLIINRQLPEAALWVIGLFIGIEMIFNGWFWVMLSFGLRRSGKTA